MPFRGGSDMTWINDRNPAAINAMARAKVLHDAKKVHSQTYRGWTGGDVYRGLTKSEVDSILPKLSKEQDAWDEVNAYESLPSDKNIFEQILEAVKGEPASESAVNEISRLMDAASSTGAATKEVASVIANSIKQAVAESASTANQDVLEDEQDTSLESAMPRGSPMIPLPLVTPQRPPSMPRMPPSTRTPTQRSPDVIDPNQFSSPANDSASQGAQDIVEVDFGSGMFNAIRSAFEAFVPQQLEAAVRAGVQAAAPAATPPQQARIQRRAIEIAYTTFDRFNPEHAALMFKAENNPGQQWRRNKAGYPRLPRDQYPDMSPSSYYNQQMATLRARDEAEHEARLRLQAERDAEQVAMMESLQPQSMRGQGFTMTRRRRVGGLGTVTAPRSSVSRAAVPGRKGSKDAALYRKLRKAFLPTNMGWYYEPRRPGASNYIDAEEIKRARWGRPWRHFRSTAPHNLTHMIPLKVLNPRMNIAVAPPPLPTALLESQVHRISGMGKRRRSRSVHQRRVR